MRGYVPHCDGFDVHALQAGLCGRVGIVLESYDERATEMVFPAATAIAILTSVLEALKGECFTLGFGGTRMEFHEWAAAEAGKGWDAEPFERAVIRKGVEVVAIVVLVPFFAFGGPEPYHDAYVFSVYLREDDVDDVIRACLAAASGAGESAPPVVLGRNAPLETLWDKLRRLL